MTDKEIIIESRIFADPEFAQMCLLRLHEEQEEDEQDAHQTMHTNGRGFTKADSSFLSMCVDHIQHDMPVDFFQYKDMLRKYVKQLSNLLTDRECDM